MTTNNLPHDNRKYHYLMSQIANYWSSYGFVPHASWKDSRVRISEAGGEYFGQSGMRMESRLYYTTTIF